MAPLSLTLERIVERLGGEVAGDASRAVSGVATLDDAGPGDIAFLANPRYRSRLAATRAGAVILGPRDREATALPRIVADNPYAYYARTVALFHPPRAAVAGIHPTAVVDATASVAASAEVGPGAVISAGARVGERAVIGAGSVLGEGASVGEDTVLHARVTIDHGGGWFTRYAHLKSDIVVACHQTVRQGALLSVTWNTGVTYGAHLHFEIIGYYTGPGGVVGYGEVNPWCVLPGVPAARCF